MANAREMAATAASAPERARASRAGSVHRRPDGTHGRETGTTPRSARSVAAFRASARSARCRESTAPSSPRCRHAATPRAMAARSAAISSSRSPPAATRGSASWSAGARPDPAAASASTAPSSVDFAAAARSPSSAIPGTGGIPASVRSMGEPLATPRRTAFTAVASSSERNAPSRPRARGPSASCSSARPSRRSPSRSPRSIPASGSGPGLVRERRARLRAAEQLEPGLERRPRQELAEERRRRDARATGAEPGVREVEPGHLRPPPGSPPARTPRSGQARSSREGSVSSRTRRPATRRTPPRRSGAALTAVRPAASGESAAIAARAAFLVTGIDDDLERALPRLRQHLGEQPRVERDRARGREPRDDLLPQRLEQAAPLPQELALALERERLEGGPPVRLRVRPRAREERRVARGGLLPRVDEDPTRARAPRRRAPRAPPGRPPLRGPAGAPDTPRPISP